MGVVFFCSIYIAHNTCVYNVCACVSMFLKLSNTGLRSHKVCFRSPHVFIASFKNLLPLPRKPSVIRIWPITLHLTQSKKPKVTDIISMGTTAKNSQRPKVAPYLINVEDIWINFSLTLFFLLQNVNSRNLNTFDCFSFFLISVYVSFRIFYWVHSQQFASFCLGAFIGGQFTCTYLARTSLSAPHFKSEKEQVSFKNKAIYSRVNQCSFKNCS